MIMANMHWLQRKMIRVFADGNKIFSIDKQDKKIKSIQNKKKALDNYCSDKDFYSEKADNYIKPVEHYYNRLVKKINDFENFSQYMLPDSKTEIGDLFTIGDFESARVFLWILRTRNKKFRKELKKLPRFTQEKYENIIFSEDVIKDFCGNFVPHIQKYEYSLCLPDCAVVIQDYKTLSFNQSKFLWVPIMPNWLIFYEYFEDPNKIDKTYELPNKNPLDSLYFNKMALDQSERYLFGKKKTLEDIHDYIDWDMEKFNRIMKKAYDPNLNLYLFKKKL